MKVSDGATLNTLLQALRDERAWSQRDVVERYNRIAGAGSASAGLTENTLSRYERGVIRWPDPVTRRLLAAVFDVEPAALGFRRPSAPPTQEADPGVAAGQARWRTTRQHLNEHRRELADLALRLHDPLADPVGLLTRPGWIAPAPLPLGKVVCRWEANAGQPVVSGREEASASVRPVVATQRRAARYSHAVRDLDPPRLFENRLGYRLVDVDLPQDGGVVLSFGDTTYFAMLDVCEAVAHELAAAVGVLERAPSPGLVWPRLPLRRLVGDPLDLGRRSVLPSINTLTLRRSRTGARFFLHQRDASRVAVAGGTAHVVPAGVFQPSSALPAAHDEDFDLWRGILREFSEEFLGQAEHDGTGAPIDYEADEPFRTLEEARRAGAVRAFWLGLGVDGLTLAGELLTVAVIDDDVFDLVFGDLVRRNAEGELLGDGSAEDVPRGFPFTEAGVGALLGGRRLAPSAQACLRLAWEHREGMLA